MSIYETVIRHIDQGNTYSWDLTALLGLGVAVSAPLREKLLLGKTTAEEGALVISAYTRDLLDHWRD